MSKCSLLMRLHSVDLRREEKVKISDDGCLSPGNGVQQSWREGWSSQIHLEEDERIMVKQSTAAYTDNF